MCWEKNLQWVGAPALTGVSVLLTSPQPQTEEEGGGWWRLMEEVEGPRCPSHMVLMRSDCGPLGTSCCFNTAIYWIKWFQIKVWGTATKRRLTAAVFFLCSFWLLKFKFLFSDEILTRADGADGADGAEGALSLKLFLFNVFRLLSATNSQNVTVDAWNRNVGFGYKVNLKLNIRWSVHSDVWKLIWDQLSSPPEPPGDRPAVRIRQSSLQRHQEQQHQETTSPYSYSLSAIHLSELGFNQSCSICW